MDSTVKLRPNHYELLGLTPSATGEEIAQAFAKELGLLRPRAFGSLAEVTVAYETLRDPIKRKAYDQSIGIKADVEPQPRPALSLAGRLEGAALGTPPPKPVVQLKSPPPPPPGASARPRPEPRPQARMAPSATALLRQPISLDLPQRDPPSVTRPESPIQAQPKRRPEPYPPGDSLPPPPPMEEAHRDEAQWKLPALAAGALILAVGGGAWMGLDSGNDAEQDQLKPAVSLKVPPAKAVSPIAVPSDQAMRIAKDEPIPPKRTAVSAREENARPPLEIDLPDGQPPEVAALEQQQREISAEQPTALSPTAATSKMPLPNSVVARTIGRIGYPCGNVASTVPVEGAAPGVFKVTCTSGHSYRATPVNGRYRFRRLGSR